MNRAGESAVERSAASSAPIAAVDDLRMNLATFSAITNRDAHSQACAFEKAVELSIAL